MKAYETTKLGQNRGCPRLWIEGRKARSAGFLPGCRFNARKDVERTMLVLELSEVGNRIVSRKIKGETEIPIIDINSSEALSVLAGYESVRVIVQHRRIIIMPLATDLAKKERVERLRKKLDNGEPLAVGSMSYGGGVLSHALHKGLSDSGVNVRLAFANEIRPELIEQASEVNPSWDDETIYLATPMQELCFDAWAMNQLPKVEIYDAGLPCSGASVSGRARRGLSHPEEHPDVGHLIVAFLAVLAKVNPIVVLLENVVQYGSSASMSILRNQLHDMGYKVHETTLKADEWNELEHRTRLCMVAVTEGMEFDFHKIKRPVRQVRQISEILDFIPENDSSWSKMEGLRAKEIRDKEAGKGFAMQIVTGRDSKCPTITKGFAKVRSTDPKLQSDFNPELLRQFTPREHARLKGVPEELISGLSNTIAHELLGQSICFGPFRAVGELIGDSLKAFTATEEASKGLDLQPLLV